MTDPGTDPVAIAATHAAAAADHAAAAQQSANAAQQAQSATADLVEQLKVVVGAPTTSFQVWQQVPAWVLLGAAILGGAFLIAYHPANSSDAWVAVIVALFLGVILSYRAAFTLGGDSNPPSPPAPPSEAPTATQPTTKP